MGPEHRTRDQLLEELDEMQKKLDELEACRAEFSSIEGRYKRLLGSTPDAMVFTSRDSEIVLVNAQMEKMFGYRKEELIGKHLHMLIPERYRARHDSYVQDYFDHPRVRNMGSNLEIYALRKDGTEIPVDISLSPIETDEGFLVTAAIRDITDRRKAQDLIQRNYEIQRVISSVLEISLQSITLQEQLEKILDLTLSIPALTLQSRGAIYLADTEKQEIVLTAQRGFTKEEVIPCKRVPFGKCLCGKAISECTLVHAECVDEKHEIRYEGIFPHGHYCVPIVSDHSVLGLINVFVKQGHKRNHVEGQFLTAIANSLAGLIKHDRAERERVTLREQLAQAEKFAALGRISANVAHDIRNPLTVVGGFARRLHKTLRAGTKEREYADLIVTEVDHLEEMLKKVLSYSRAAAPQLEPQDMIRVIEDVLQMFDAMFKEKSIIVQRSFHDISKVHIDEVQIREVIENLFSNAIDAMPRGGTLTAAVEQQLIKGSSYVVITFQDTGEGIPEDKLETIFEPFYSTKVEKRGTGLGLPIVKKIIEDHAGFIRVESTSGVGAAFSLYLPVK